MPLLIDAAGLSDRRDAAAGALAPLTDALVHELTPLLEHEPVIPEQKALLTRVGGWCPRDGARLEFDPSSPHAHRCPACGAVEVAGEHHRLWIMWYQLWLAERTVHAALLYILRHDERHATLARSLLGRWADLYHRYPNRDNALGPTRVFFSTYLESIWLLQLCIALDLLEHGDAIGRCGGDIRERLIAPSRALIASFDEGGSNRQVWNAAALLASARLLGDPRGCEEAVYGRSGVRTHLANGLLADGTWFEGENYHLFAHRGLWYGVTLAEQAGLPLPDELLARFEEGFATPFLAALPDFTLPARRDSQYAISLRQWRVAELCELGLARRDDPRLLGALGELYAGDAPHRRTGRDRSAAEVERNEPASALSRADLGWKSLLCARPQLPQLARHALASVLLEGQGLAILRREHGRVHASLDYGHSGGGHGHPDRLNIQLAVGDARWLDDPGTGSYVDRSLHWYRSTLAHNAPLIDGRSQARVRGRLLAWQDETDAGWVRAGAADIAPGVRMVRTIVALDDYLLDVLEWDAEHEVVLALPIHLDGEMPGVRHWIAEPLDGGDGVEDGFDFLRGVEHAALASDPAAVTLRARRGDATIEAHVHAPGGEWWRAVAPAPPGQGDARFFLLRLRGESGRVVSSWSWHAAVASLEASAAGIAVLRRDGARHVHRATESGWRIERTGNGKQDEVRLGGKRGPDASGPAEPPEGHPGLAGGQHALAAAVGAEPLPLVVPTDPVEADWLTFELGGRDYRRSEETWREAGAPTASVRLAIVGRTLTIEVRVHEPAPRFAPAEASNPFDNEHPDIDGSGMQLYVAREPAAGGRSERVAAAPSLSGWMLVPEPAQDAVRVRPIAGYATGPAPIAEYRPSGDGWHVVIRMPPGDAPLRALRLGLIVNTVTPGRERRAGQLVLGGAAGEWTYLRGDRHAPGRLLPFVVANA